jgi:hypothetical protein
MDVPLEPIKPIQEFNLFAILSCVLGVVTMTFPAISLFYLVVQNGGAGYLQSISCGIPFTFASIITGIVSLVLISRKNQHGAAQAAGKGAWMAIVGIVLVTLALGMDIIMVAVLITPFLSGTAG